MVWTMLIIHAFKPVPFYFAAILNLGHKHTLFGLFRHVYRGYTVGNRVFLATPVER